MTRSTLQKTIGYGCLIAGLLIIITVVVHGALYAPDKEVALASRATSTAFAVSEAVSPTSTPVHISIPSIGVDTNVQKVGITYKGNMGVPNNYTDTGWYKYGTVPGEVGSAVIDGHVDNGFGTPAVFENLKNMKIGDSVFVTMDNGTVLHFVVVDIETYYYKSAPLQEIFNQTDAARLNLITCTGDWVSADQTDDHRIVVYTKLVP